MKPCLTDASTTLESSVNSDPLPAWKRAIDLACCLAALPALLPLATIVAMITRFSSPGPILFKQPRVGYRGKQFLCLKFRTMKLNAETTGHQQYLKQVMGSNAPMTKLDAKGDSRLIPMGWLLRATGLDELPQIINVFRGEMSIVGPRPCIPYEYENYNAYQRGRFNSTPGLTGLWQVSGKNKTTFDQMIRLDIDYGHKKSFLFDLRIIVMTVPALLQQVLETRASRRAHAQVAAAKQEGAAQAAALGDDKEKAQLNPA